MKKLGFIALALVFGIIAFSASFTSANAWVGDWYENEDIAFNSIMQEMKDDQGYDYDTYTFVKAPLYSTAATINGYVFDFILDGQRDGYILMTAVIGGYEVTEIYVDTQSLFFNNAGTNIYPTFLEYISYNNGIYYDLKTNIQIDEVIVTALEAKGFGFSGGSTYNDYIEYVYYATKTVTTDQISIKFPGYVTGVDGINTCVPNAGMHLIGYWDYYKENLVPNYTVYNTVYGVMVWKGSAPPNVGNSLYNLMETNSTGEGTTVAQFKNGMTKYASLNGGYSVVYTSTMTSGNYDMTKMLNSFAAGKPVAMFMIPQFNYIMAIDTNTAGGYDYIGGNDYFNSAHAMVAYGRQINKYLNSSGAVIRQITFLKVASCLQTSGLGWVRLNEGYLNVNDSFSVEII